MGKKGEEFTDEEKTNAKHVANALRMKLRCFSKVPMKYKALAGGAVSIIGFCCFKCWVLFCAMKAKDAKKDGSEEGSGDEAAGGKKKKKKKDKDKKDSDDE